MSNKPTGPSGLLLVDKPTEWTSHDVVKFVRGFTRGKVGHCGTLDPGATGLLVLVLGRATKLTSRFSTQDKEYQGTMRLGIETDSQDADGEVVAEADWSAVTEAQVRTVMAGFVGDQEQIPPMVSAKKQGGQKLYQLARQGITVDREPKPITIHELEISRVELPEVDFRVRCSKGTYVRTLCYDIGRQLGCGAHLARLRRLASGNFHVDKAYDMDTIRNWSRDDLLAHLMPLEETVAYL